MKKKTWLTYLIIIILILFVVFWGKRVFNGYQEFTEHNITINPVIFETVFYIVLGLLLGLEHLIEEVKKIGRWRINIAKLVLFGIPSLYFSFGSYIYYGLGGFLPDLLTAPIAILINNKPYLLPVFQIILGYSIITSFIKRKRAY